MERSNSFNYISQSQSLAEFAFAMEFDNEQEENCHFFGEWDDCHRSQAVEAEQAEEKKVTELKDKEARRMEKRREHRHAIATARNYLLSPPIKIKPCLNNSSNLADQTG